MFLELLPGSEAIRHWALLGFQKQVFCSENIASLIPDPLRSSSFLIIPAAVYAYSCNALEGRALLRLLSNSCDCSLRKLQSSGVRCDGHAHHLFKLCGGFGGLWSVPYQTNFGRSGLVLPQAPREIPTSRELDRKLYLPLDSSIRICGTTSVACCSTR